MCVLPPHHSWNAPHFSCGILTNGMMMMRKDVVALVLLVTLLMLVLLVALLVLLVALLVLLLTLLVLLVVLMVELSEERISSPSGTLHAENAGV